MGGDRPVTAWGRREGQAGMMQSEPGLPRRQRQINYRGIGDAADAGFRDAFASRASIDRARDRSCRYATRRSGAYTAQALQSFGRITGIVAGSVPLCSLDYRIM
jgi:hypothetical protein